MFTSPNPSPKTCLARCTFTQFTPISKTFSNHSWLQHRPQSKPSATAFHCNTDSKTFSNCIWWQHRPENFSATTFHCNTDLSLNLQQPWFHCNIESMNANETQATPSTQKNAPDAKTCRDPSGSCDVPNAEKPASHIRRVHRTRQPLALTPDGPHVAPTELRSTWRLQPTSLFPLPFCNSGTTTTTTTICKATRTYNLHNWNISASLGFRQSGNSTCAQFGVQSIAHFGVQFGVQSGV